MSASFVDAGATVVFCARNEAQGNALASRTQRAGQRFARISFNAMFLRLPKSESLIAQTVERFGKIDCLINNAGWHPPHHSIDEFSVQDFRDLLELNLVSIFAACKAALPHLRKTQGNIINLSSLVGFDGAVVCDDVRGDERRDHGLQQSAWRWTKPRMACV